MLISDTHQFIFIHVPKCAGTTARKALSKYDTRNNFFWMHHSMAGPLDSDKPLLVDKGHMPLGLMRHIYPSDFSLLSEYTVFAFSRHPVARLVSGFFEPRRALLKMANDLDSNANSRKILAQEFEKFVKQLLLNANFLSKDFVHVTPQYQYHLVRNKRLTDVTIRLEAPTEGLRSLSVICPAAAEALANALRQSHKENEKKNIHSLNLWQSLEPSLQDQCRRLYAKDFSLLGYE